MAARYDDWLRQAERDLELSATAQERGIHEWSCFAAQQAAEKALKALHLAKGQEAWGHVVRTLLEELPDDTSVDEDLKDIARILDGYYIPTRYANGHVEGAPFEHYGERQSREAIDHARTIIEFCRSHMANAQ